MIHSFLNSANIYEIVTSFLTLSSDLGHEKKKNTYLLTYGTVRGECNFLGSVLSQQTFEAMNVKALSTSQLSDSVTAPCYSSVLFRKQRKIHP